MVILLLNHLSKVKVRLKWGQVVWKSVNGCGFDLGECSAGNEGSDRSPRSLLMVSSLSCLVFRNFAEVDYLSVGIPIHGLLPCGCNWVNGRFSYINSDMGFPCKKFPSEAQTVHDDSIQGKTPSRSLILCYQVTSYSLLSSLMTVHF